MRPIAISCLLLTGALGGCASDVFTDQSRGILTENRADSILRGNVTDYTNVTVGGYHVCAINATGIPRCWGRNDFGQLGNGTQVNASTPAAVSGGLMIASIAAGGSHSCGILIVAGQFTNFYCWGNGLNGRLGSGGTTGSLTPRVIPPVFVQTGAFAGEDHTCSWAGFLLKCWGANARGQIGDATTIDRLSPVSPLSPPTTIVAYSPGSHFTCAVQGSGTLGIGPGPAYCWGQNTFGQLGDGTTIDRYLPVTVVGGVAFKEVRAGGSHACGLTGNGVAYCWGLNDHGQLGTGDFVTRSAPALVSTTQRFSSITAGGSYSCGIATTSNRIYCWGDGTSGALGVGDVLDHSVPTVVIGTFVYKIVRAGLHATTCAVTTIDRIYCWGSTEFGQTGLGVSGPGVFSTAPSNPVAAW